MNLSGNLLRSWRWVHDGIRWRKARGHLGLSPEECRTKYGEVKEILSSSSLYPEYEFEAPGVDVSVIFRNGQAVAIWYASDRPFRRDFVDACFSALAIGKDWNPLPRDELVVSGLFGYAPDSEYGGYWERNDGSAWACLARAGSSEDDARYHLDFTSGDWQRVRRLRNGVWS